MKIRMAILLIAFALVLSGCSAPNTIAEQSKPAETASATVQETAQESVSSAPAASSEAPPPSAVSPDASDAPAAAASASENPTSDGTDAAYAMNLYKDKMLEMMIPEGWQAEKKEGELARFSGPIKTGGTGLVTVQKINKSFKDPAEYNGFTETLVKEKHKDCTVKDLKGFQFKNQAGKTGWFITLNYQLGEDTGCELYYYLPEGKSSFMICCACEGEDFNSIFKTYMAMILSFKDK